MVSILKKISERVLEAIDGVQVSFEKQRLAVGDIDGLVVPSIRRVDSGSFDRAQLRMQYIITIEIYTRGVNILFWFEMAERILKVLTGFQIETYLTPLDFKTLTFFGLKENLFFGEATFVVFSYKGEI